jgi:translation initiation factor IF-3
MHQDIAFSKMNEVVEELKDISEVEKKASVEGRNMTMILGPSAQVQKK